MIYRPVKKTWKRGAHLPQALLLAVLAVLLIWSPTRALFETLVIKSAGWMRPERANQLKSLSDVLLLERIKDLKSENDRLRGNLNLSREIVKPAKVVLGGGYLFADVLILNEGREAGIKIGDIVFTPENILVGKVAEAGPGWSKVRPISALGEKTVLRGGNNKGLVFEAEGRGLGEIEGALSPNLQIRPGDVLWWGEDQQIIAALVDRVDGAPSAPFYKIIMVSPLKLFSISDVLVVEP